MLSDQIAALTGSAGDFKMVNARIGQYLKTIEQSTLAGGSWKMAWLLTGLPEPRPQGQINQGLTHPSEFAAGVAYLKETKVLEQPVRGKSTASWSAQGGEDSGKGGGKKKPWWEVRKLKQDERTAAAAAAALNAAKAATGTAAH